MFLEKQLEESVRFCRYASVSLVFPRRKGYKELEKLSLTNLFPDVNFDIHAPGSVSHAHLRRNLYII